MADDGPARRPRERFGVLGCGRIGQRLAARLPGTPDAPQLVALLCRPGQRAEVAARFGEAVTCTDLTAFIARSPDVAVECASAATLASSGPALLAEGIDLIPLSLAALADRDVEERLFAAARKGPGRIEIPAGAAASLGFLAAAREDVLTAVTLRVAYPPARLGAAGVGDGQGVPQLVFAGSVREAAARFPRHLNVSVAVALAGLGLDATRLELTSDPGLTQATFEVVAEAGPGPVRIFVGGRGTPVADDPADYTTFTLMRLLRRRQAAIMV
ncbi:aspartate dehydrogenase domain-containing protein [Roseomonas sp. WA12]